MTRVFKQVSNLNKTGAGVEALVVVGVRVELEAGRAPDDDALALVLVGVRVELEAGRAPDDDALAVAPVDAAGLGAPGVEARAVAPARLAVDFAFAFALPPGVEAREVAACALRALPNFQRLARTSCLWHAMNCSFQSWEFWRSFSTAHRSYCSLNMSASCRGSRHG